MQPKTRVCRHCGRRRPVTEFFKNVSHGRPELRPECKPCTLKARDKTVKGLPA